VSNATAIDPEARELLYTEMFGPDGTFTGRRRMTMTPPQGRRYRHKLNRAWGGYETVYEDTPAAERPKGHPTPRRADAIRGRLALRRFAEALPGKLAEVAAR
jgi:hypothetical protein